MDLDSDVLKPLGTFLVEYREGDFLGHGLAYFSQVPILAAMFIIGFWFRARDLHSPTMSVGLVLCVAVNLVLKNVFKQPRPYVHTHLKTYGMPSDHSQYMGFLATYVTGLICTRCRPLRSRLMLFSYGSAVVGVWTLALLVCCCRVYLQYHSPEQVIVGCCVGSGLALVWLSIVLNVLEPYFSTIASWPLLNLILDVPHR
ncbi:dolichyldiphosphatase 1-like [Sycon ciliatum]|uniref:dolichyldiphosphatase 1-like n=1 Tax=Sycon ciliatum TaxID=27933 RepID=UPI0031F6B2FF